MHHNRPALAAFFTFCVSVIYAQGFMEQFPVKGQHGKDFWISYYFDHDSTQGIRTAYCNNITYNYHNGTDFAISNFAKMDSGVNVYPVAKGVVAETHDGEFDRHYRWKKKQVANSVTIHHFNGYTTRYFHLKKNSITVVPGDTVDTERAIGQIGSSGLSDGPHVHLEVIDPDCRTVDPFAGPCNPAGTSLWKNNVSPDTAFSIISSGFAPYKSSKRIYIPAIPVADTLQLYKNGLILFWIGMYGLKAGDQLKAEWHSERGVLMGSVNQTLSNNKWFYVFYTWRNLGYTGFYGSCIVKVFMNNRQLLAKSVYIPPAKQ